MNEFYKSIFHEKKLLLFEVLISILNYTVIWYSVVMSAGKRNIYIVGGIYIGTTRSGR